MGAKDVEIRLEEIRGLDYAGALSRTFLVKTDAKAHKFEGGQAKLVWTALEKALVHPKNAAAHSTKGPGLSCVGCSKPLEPYFTFCPHCATRIKTACVSCHKTVDPSWAACASCGWKFAH